MRKFFFLLILLLELCLGAAHAQDISKITPGVIVFYTRKNTIGGYPTKFNMGLSVNKIQIPPINQFKKITLNIYSEGVIRINVIRAEYSRENQVRILNGDTIYCKISLSTKQSYDNIVFIRSKSEYIEDIKDSKIKEEIVIYEDLSVPFNPISSTQLGREQSRAGSGTGFLISELGYIATNNHVIDGAKQITVKGMNGNPKSILSASVVLRDPVNDLALLKLDDRVIIDSMPYALRREQADVGQHIYVLGYPRPTEMGTEIKLTDGLISSKSGFDGRESISTRSPHPSSPATAEAPSLMPTETLSP